MVEAIVSFSLIAFAAAAWLFFHLGKRAYRRRGPGPAVPDSSFLATLLSDDTTAGGLANQVVPPPVPDSVHRHATHHVHDSHQAPMPDAGAGGFDGGGHHGGGHH